MELSRRAHISAITESELKVGIHRASTEEHRTKRELFIKAILSNVVVLPIDSKVADVHARMVAQLYQSGMIVGPHDCWIAATAVHYDFPLLTTNAREFSYVPGLRVINYLSDIGSQ